MSANRGKTICFIDNANIFHGQRVCGWRIDWERFAGFFQQGDDPLWQTYFFASEHDPPSAEETAFFDFLKEKMRWEVMLYRLGRRTERCGACGNEQTVPAEKGVDVGLATKMLSLAINRAYDTAILVSGDRDYVETVQVIKGLGLRVEVVSWRGGLSKDLEAESSAPVVVLDDLERDLRKGS